MSDSTNTLKYLGGNENRELFERLYGTSKDAVDWQLKRYSRSIKAFLTRYRDGELHLFSTPGRTEIGGNHTDHNHGRVLAAGINLDSIAVVSETGNNLITLCSEGFPNDFVVDIRDLNPKDDEAGTTKALIRGIAASFMERRHRVGGFNAYVTSDVFQGSGLSSSASIEVLVGTIMNHLFNGGSIDLREIAVIGRYAENVFFKKPCGLMDQIACAVGGIVAIDFNDSRNPIVERIDFDFSEKGYGLVVINTGGSHADLTEEYAAIPNEMRHVAESLEGRVMRDISYPDLLNRINLLRSSGNDRAILRALHFLFENERVLKQVEALKKDDFKEFLHLVNESGDSSWKWLQNCYTPKNPMEQNISLALAFTDIFLEELGEGACRVHGGGFAGTIQVFLPNRALKEYSRLIETIFGKGAATLLSIRPFGTLRIC